MSMDPYGPDVVSAMQVFYDSLSEKDKRRYAAVEVLKLGHGGTEVIAKLLSVDQKTIRRGLADLESSQEMELPTTRKKGAGRRPN